MNSVAIWTTSPQAGSWEPLDLPTPAEANPQDVAFWNPIWTDRRRLDMGGWNISHVHGLTSAAEPTPQEYWPDDTDYRQLYENYPDLLG